MAGFPRWGHRFDGPYPTSASLENRSGVYVVWCEDGGEWAVLDVGESEEVRDRLLNHDRTDCWRRNSSKGGTIYYSATYTPGEEQAARIMIERLIRGATVPIPCGER